MPSDQTQVYPELTPKDLQDPTLFRLNQVINFLYSQVAQTQGITGDFSFTNPKAKSIAVPGSAYGLLTLGAARTLFSSGSGSTPTPPSSDVNNELEDHTGGLSCTASFADVGVQVTLNEDGVWMIIATFDATVNVAGILLTGQLVVNGVTQTGQAFLACSSATSTDLVRASIARSWVYTNSGSNVAKLQAKVASTAGGGAGAITTASTNILAVFLHS